MCDLDTKIYEFYCGCKSVEFALLKRKDRVSQSKFCPVCYDPTKTTNATANQHSRLKFIHTYCHYCNAPVSLSSNKLGNTRTVICDACFAYRANKNPDLTKTRGDNMEMIIGNCPCCKRDHLIPKYDKYGFDNPVRQFCGPCKERSMHYDDRDPGFYDTDSALIYFEDLYSDLF